MHREEVFIKAIEPLHPNVCIRHIRFENKISLNHEKDKFQEEEIR